MSDYAKVTVTVVSSPNSDYSSPDVSKTLTYTLTPDEVQYTKVEVATSATEIIKAGLYTTIYAIIVKNNNATNYVIAGYTEQDLPAADTPATPTNVIAPGKVNIFTDVDAAVAFTLTADTAACTCEVIVLAT
jgi:hypothetical protein